MESFIREHVLKHLLKNRLLSNKQCGFINGRSTTTRLLYYLDQCVATIAEGGVIDTIYLDFAKAFDTVPHYRLLGKLQAYGIQGKLFHWIKEFLKERTQIVMINGVESEPTSVLSGIPQGTVLGPLLFVVYINDILDKVMAYYSQTMRKYIEQLLKRKMLNPSKMICVSWKKGLINDF